jgi:hypothetical protein
VGTPASGRVTLLRRPPHFTIATDHPLNLGDGYSQRHQLTWLNDDNLGVPEHQVCALGPHAVGVNLSRRAVTAMDGVAAGWHAATVARMGL